MGSVAAVLVLASLAAGTGQGEGGRPEPSGTAGIPELALDAALAELERQSLDLAQARSRAEEAAAVERQVAAQLVPSLDARASYEANSDEAPPPGLVPGPTRLVIQTEERFTATGSVRLPLVVPAAWFEVRAARGGSRAADASADATARRLRAGFAQAAHAARAGEEVVVASERAVETAAEHARSAQRRVNAGIAPPLEALRARTEQVRRESDLARARADLGRSRLALGILLGRDGPVRVLVPEGAAAPEAAADPGAPADAVERRAEVRAQRARRDAAEEQVRASSARLFPQVSASGSAFASDMPLVTGEKDGWRFTVDLTWAIYDGGLREARRRQARAQLAGARAAEEAQRLAVVQEVQDGARDLAVTRERLRLAETQRTLAADAAESARRSFEAGVASNLDVMDANDRLYQADVGLADARARVAQAAIALEHARGL
jgi:outer membrane protein TolC